MDTAPSPPPKDVDDDFVVTTPVYHDPDDEYHDIDDVAGKCRFYILDC